MVTTYKLLEDTDSDLFVKALGAAVADSWLPIYDTYRIYTRVDIKTVRVVYSIILVNYIN
jgi:hypothetical protein